jgi:hypothetical protein
MVKQLKNRYNETAASRKFMLGIDRSKMKLYDVADDASVISIEGDNEEQLSQFSQSQNRLSKFAEWNV